MKGFDTGSNPLQAAEDRGYPRFDVPGRLGREAGVARWNLFAPRSADDCSKIIVTGRPFDEGPSRVDHPVQTQIPELGGLARHEQGQE